MNLYNSMTNKKKSGRRKKYRKRSNFHFASAKGCLFVQIDELSTSKRERKGKEVSMENKFHIQRVLVPFQFNRPTVLTPRHTTSSPVSRLPFHPPINNSRNDLLFHFFTFKLFFQKLSLDFLPNTNHPPVLGGWDNSICFHRASEILYSPAEKNYFGRMGSRQKTGWWKFRKNKNINPREKPPHTCDLISTPIYFNFLSFHHFLTLLK